MRNEKTGKLDDCAIRECGRESRPRSSWCGPCKSWLYRWIKMGSRERDAYRERGDLRMGRLIGLGNGKGRVLRMKLQKAS